jgi:hypothetical protein
MRAIEGAGEPDPVRCHRLDSDNRLGIHEVGEKMKKTIGFFAYRKSRFSL